MKPVLFITRLVKVRFDTYNVENFAQQENIFYVNIMSETGMNEQDLKRFFNQHCRFKLKSGKEVFGVIWQDESLRADEVNFASVKDHEAHVTANTKDRTLRMKAREIVYAESFNQAKSR